LSAGVVGSSGAARPGRGGLLLVRGPVLRRFRRMELIVAVIIGVVAAGAVLAPLVRRDRGGVRAAGGRRSVHVRTPAAAGASRDSQAGDPAESEAGARSEERRVGKECRSRGAPDHARERGG